MSTRILQTAEAGKVTVFNWASVHREPEMPMPPESLIGGADRHHEARADGQPEAKPPPAPPEPEITKAELLEMRLVEFEAGVPARLEAARVAGYQDGVNAGMSEANESVRPIAQRLAKSIEEVTGYKSRFRKEAEQDLVRLAMAVARKILKRELHLDSQTIVAVLRVSMESLDVRDLHSIRMHPQDAGVVRDQLTSMGIPARVKVIDDPTIERGGLVYDTVRGKVDASIDTQLSEIERGFADMA